jgi:hypothetical protein
MFFILHNLHIILTFITFSIEIFSLFVTNLLQNKKGRNTNN